MSENRNCHKNFAPFFLQFKKTVLVFDTEDCGMVIATESPTSTKRKVVGFTDCTSQKSMLEKFIVLDHL